MAKKPRKAGEVDKQKLVAVMKAFEKEYGEGSVYGLGSSKSNMNIPRWSTGIDDLDAILGGGIPYGRVIEISGPESSGKTTLAYWLMAQHDIAVDIPIEGTFDGSRAKSLGNRKGQLVINNARYGEQALEAVMAYAQAGVPIIVIDSVPFMITRKEFEEPDFEKEGQRSRIAAMLSKQLPKIGFTCEKTYTTLIFINQVRDNMNAMAFGPTTTTPGGRALKHACSIRMQVNRMRYITVPNKNPSNSAATEAVGIVMKVKVIKSKVCVPMGECTLSLFFDRGFVSNDDVTAVRKEIMAENLRKYKGRRKATDDEEDDE